MGASTRVRSCSANSAPRACVSKGLDEEVSMIIVPGWSEEAMPCGPRRTSRTILPWGSMVIIVEQGAKDEGRDLLAVAGVVFGHSDAALRDLDGSVSWTTRW